VASHKQSPKKEVLTEMEEFQGITLKGKNGEMAPAFSGRLSVFWTLVLRQVPELFEKVYAETTEFEDHQGCPTRKYAVEPDGVAPLLQLVQANGLEFLPPDPDDTYTRHEAVAPEWWQIEH
jgi:hypothetical protein